MIYTPPFITPYLLFFNFNLGPTAAVILSILGYIYEVYSLSFNSWWDAHPSPLNINSNSLLMTNINNYHLFIFYFEICLLLNLCFLLPRSTLKNPSTWACEVAFYNILQHVTFGFVVTPTAIYLGSWWALQ